MTDEYNNLETPPNLPIDLGVNENSLRQSSDELFDQLLYDPVSGKKLDDETIKKNIVSNYSRIINFTDDIYGLLNSTPSSSLSDTCMNLIEDWRYFLHSNNERLPNHIYGLRADFDEAVETTGQTQAFQTLVEAGLTNRGRMISGRATREARDKTVPIDVERRIKEPVTGKYLRFTKRHLIHDEFNITSAGGLVVAIECRPISKRKHFRLLYSGT